MTSIITDTFLQDNIWSNPSLEDAKNKFAELIRSTKINAKDKLKMLNEIAKIPSKERLDMYAVNAKFKFEGLGVI